MKIDCFKDGVISFGSSHIKRFLILAAFLIVAHSTSYAQQFLQSKNTLNDDAIIDILELPNGDLVFAATRFSPTAYSTPMDSLYSVQSTIYKTDAFGAILQEKKIKYLGDSSVYLNSLFYENGQILLFGMYGLNRTQVTFNNIFALELDANFNTISSRDYQIAGTNSGLTNSMNAKKISNGYLLNASRTNGSTSMYTFVLRINSSLDSMSSIYLTDNNRVSSDIIERLDSPNHYVLAAKNLGASFGHYFGYLDSAFVFTKVMKLPVSSGNLGMHRDPFYLEQKDNNTFYCISNYTFGPSSNNKIVIAVSEFAYGDSAFIHLDSIPNVGVDNSKYIAPYGAVDTDLSGNLLYGCTTHILTHPSYQLNRNYIGLRKIDSGFMEEWTRYFGGDAFYSIHKIRALQSGEFIIAGMRLDTSASPIHRDFYIFKISELGVPLWTKNIAIQKSKHKIVLFPNPSTSKLFLKSSGEIDLFEIISFDGQRIASFPKLTKHFDLEKLAAGNYFLRVFFADGEVGLEKFIKK